MRVTGVAVTVIGLAIMTFCGIMWGMYNAGGIGDPGDIAHSQATAANFMIPLAISGLTVTTGLALAVFGDKGFKFSRNLAERN